MFTILWLHCLSTGAVRVTLFIKMEFPVEPCRSHRMQRSYQKLGILMANCTHSMLTQMPALRSLIVHAMLVQFMDTTPSLTLQPHKVLGAGHFSVNQSAESLPPCILCMQDGDIGHMSAIYPTRHDAH
jgi:hypothetical protein